MKNQIKVGIGVFRESIQWILRFFILGAILFLIVRVYSVNPFFAVLSSSALFLMALLMPDYYFIIKEGSLVSEKVTCFGFITFRKKYKLKDIKDIVVYGYFNRATHLSDYIIPYMNHNYCNQLRLIKNDGNVDTLYYMIYIDDLESFGFSLAKEIEKNKVEN